jgi:hypothetical protein
MQHEIDELALDLIAIAEEHDKYSFPLNVNQDKWINSLPIDTLYESLNVSKGEPRSGFSLRGLPHRPKLRKLYEKIKEEFELKASELIVRKIDLILKQIGKIENEL